MQNDNRSSVRKTISLALGAAMTLAGAIGFLIESLLRHSV
jgi:hypothetical protein